MARECERKEVYWWLRESKRGWRCGFLSGRPSTLRMACCCHLREAETQAMYNIHPGLFLPVMHTIDHLELLALCSGNKKSSKWQLNRRKSVLLTHPDTPSRESIILYVTRKLSHPGSWQIINLYEFYIDPRNYFCKYPKPDTNLSILCD